MLLYMWISTKTYSSFTTYTLIVKQWFDYFGFISVYLKFKEFYFDLFCNQKTHWFIMEIMEFVPSNIWSYAVYMYINILLYRNLGNLGFVMLAVMYKW